MSPTKKSGSEAKRRIFSADTKARLVLEYERATSASERSLILSREGLSTSHISSWRRSRASCEKPESSSGVARNRVTFLICGGTGVGKSTLVNALCGRQVAEVGTGGPVTRAIGRFRSNKLGLTIFDLPGLEVKPVESIYFVLLPEVLRLRYPRRRASRLDLVLMCIPEPPKSIDGAHVEIAELCNDLKVPFGIVITKAYEDDKAFEEKVAAAFSQAAFVQRVVAVDFRPANAGVIPRRGLESLRERLYSIGAVTRPENLVRAPSVTKVERLSQLASEASTGATISKCRNALLDLARELSLLVLLKPSWDELLKTMRGKQMKALYHNPVKEFVTNRFGKQAKLRIDGANARILVRRMLRVFPESGLEFNESDIDDLLREARDLDTS